MKQRTLLALALLPFAAAYAGEEHEALARRPAVAVPVAKVTGAPQSCIPVNHIKETRVRDDSTIDFIGTGRGEAWRVSLPSPCPNLKSENRFSYATSLSQLCSTDIITVLYDYGSGPTGLQRGASCGLSHFTPIALAR